MSKSSLNTNKVHKEKGLRLSELTHKIKNELSEAFPDHYWVIAEISEIRTNYSGHAYIEFIEKDPVSEKISARIRGTIWSYTFRMLKPYFENTTGYALEAGIKVLIKASVEYHELYGLSLNIKDIDPTYTLGDLARKKAEIIEKLKQEGVIDMNKGLPLPLVPMRIAVISSETAAGFGDFKDSLLNNPYNFTYKIELFPSIMQGEGAENSILLSLGNIFERENEFDLVAIIRGGGAKADLDCFNSYELAMHIAQFPLPVFTGIGHERDETIADIVANRFLKTPTAVAEFIIDTTLEFANSLMIYEERLIAASREILEMNKAFIDSASQQVLYLSQSHFDKENSGLDQFSFRLRSGAQQITADLKLKLQNYERFSFHFSKSLLNESDKHFKSKKEELIKITKNFLAKQYEQILQFEKTNDHLNPEKILKRGFSITKFNNKVIKEANGLHEGDIIETRLYKGKIISEIKN